MNGVCEQAEAIRMFSTEGAAFCAQLDAGAALVAEEIKQIEQRREYLLAMSELHSYFLEAIEAGWEAFRAGPDHFGETQRLLNDARTIRKQANKLADCDEHKVRRTLLGRLNDALNMRILQDEANRFRILPGGADKSNAEEDDRLAMARRILLELRATLTHRPWRTLELIHQHYVVLVAIYHVELERINEAALTTLERLERTLRDDIFSRLAGNRVSEAKALLALDCYAGCRNREIMAGIIASYEARYAKCDEVRAAVDQSEATGRIGTRPGEYERGGTWVVNRRGTRFWRNGGVCNEGLQRQRAKIEVLAAAIPAAAQRTDEVAAKKSA